MRYIKNICKRSRRLNYNHKIELICSIFRSQKLQLDFLKIQKIEARKKMVKAFQESIANSYFRYLSLIAIIIYDIYLITSKVFSDCQKHSFVMRKLQCFLATYILQSIVYNNISKDLRTKLIIYSSKNQKTEL